MYKGLQVAVKKNFNPKIDEELLKEFSNEINMLAKYRHPNIVLLVGICSVPPNLAIVTEFVEGGSLYDLLHKKKKAVLKEDKRKIVRQVLSSIAFLHEHEIVHRDIKSHNFLV
jgi:serine/threonine protein kinase